MNILFICSRNQWRSPTAEHVFAVGYGIKTRSAGTSRHAKHTLSSKDIAWAELIFVMEQKHKQNIKEKFPKQLQHKKVIVLDITDDYHYMDAALVEILQDVVPPYLDDFA
ncbi:MULTISPECIES: protein tyrosine phosphatase [unclassified Acinetobacter]|uniref:low molecular weight protein tyrosine phosphatase family protein n=1 Tax=unclassified Acinetobacter TaxID=196816 RepID=UPI00257627A2|nr:MULTISPECIES: protein tyrosine phosphatase [unclassified Acinetobacter]MDM1756370.1 protein tyrosine phosphatase [Acinetobacter sp. 256-1]MDM1759509.1 protein tyrosine phosphatase [Acinetobacter sp. 251-1]